ncbi:hypothetical protein TH61_06040 [Rufibacter sp. DG15C]|uniref:DUF4783 domain-containing protein n=1 Tax=Rufibacter sp. DG15C TaxID=1379909 RepID=UPI00078D948B|nr:DUF4783 domain-containing protein [Rufibacter sp. DG15C]AMM50828.1 hypothetical protein TH61_06040 [Rufibacter sp. DG15C]
MKNMKRVLAMVVVMLGMLVGAGQVAAQSDVVAGVKSAIKSGSSRSLAQYLNTKVQVSIDGDNASYSQSQAEMVLRNFFSKNAPLSFDFEHQGGSEDGQRYAIGKYAHKGGRYTVLVRMKKYGDAYKIDTIEFK